MRIRSNEDLRFRLSGLFRLAGAALLLLMLAGCGGGTDSGGPMTDDSSTGEDEVRIGSVAREDNGDHPGGDEAEAEVQKLVGKFVRMIQTPDATPLTEIGGMLSNGFILYGSDGTIIKGREASLQAFRKGVQMTQAAFQTLAVKFAPLCIKVGKEFAVAIGQVEMKGKLKRGGRPFVRTHRVTFVFGRSKGSWQMLHKHSSVGNPKGN